MKRETSRRDGKTIRKSERKEIQRTFFTIEENV